ncbi:MAG: CPBP family intramembrane metalloprotease [Desulfarculaceae bacterium]|nr:CPBP family intramembrane metalloprotease [Desulfarculaceae bacterium]MCF8071146.1 CPBP family intramembrane metalloprotease [Desulfarculaceae bacterium]MCF8101251.1 CPBP family intramembrane metalloprotease [Desulfarculaceae bacterium]MCF8115200.1 CPBP family intramembrane metalloprotease [Desulfarculaceae bacterium]
MTTRAVNKQPVPLLLWAECLGLFFAAPVGLYFLRHQLAHRVIPLVIILAAACAWYLFKLRDFDRRSLWRVEGLGRHLKEILVALALPALPIALATYLFMQDQFLAMPSGRPAAWLLLLLLYPLLSAYPQEVVFRGFFFQRYRRLFPDPRIMVLASGVSFGLAHIFYGNWVAPLVAGLGGVLFGYRYLTSKSLVAVGMEHGLWGNLLYTIGLGWFFLSGSIS